MLCNVLIPNEKYQKCFTIQTSEIQKYIGLLTVLKSKFMIKSNDLTMSLANVVYKSNRTND